MPTMARQILIFCYYRSVTPFGLGRHFLVAVIHSVTEIGMVTAETAHFNISSHKRSSVADL